MNIKILDSWLKEFLETSASAKEIAEKLSLTSVSIERIEPHGHDFIYDIEVTTNRPDLASVIGLAREAAAVLPQFGIEAKFAPPTLAKPTITNKTAITIQNDPKLVNRVCAVVMDIKVLETPKEIQDRLETSDIRSLNNLIDITNYVMRTIGHPTHVFDYDRLGGEKLIIRESKKGETITTLDKKTHTLPGGDIVAVSEKGEIIDLLGIMGLENSVVTNQTKRILFFLDNNDPARMRKTSMSLSIRSEAVQLNEKSIDPELAYEALIYGISLYEKYAAGKVVSDIIDIYPNKPQEKVVKVLHQKLEDVIGVKISQEKVVKILTSLGFSVEKKGQVYKIRFPSFRQNDTGIEEDVIEEVARVYGYHNLPSVLPPLVSPEIKTLGTDSFFWEKKAKEAIKYWGFTETYTYSMVSEELYEGPLEDAVTIQNPLSEDHVYMRNTLVPSLLKVLEENKNHKEAKIFEIANVYTKSGNDLPTETRTLAGVIKNQNASFFEGKGILEQLFVDFCIKDFSFKKSHKGGIAAAIFIGKEQIGEIELLSDTIVDFEINFEKLTMHATLQKTYKPINKYPPVIEDVALVIDEKHATADILEEIKSFNPLIVEASLLDTYENSRTFHVVYQDPEKNLTTEEVGKIRTELLQTLEKKFAAKVK